jgi:hypothetical protein
MREHIRLLGILNIIWSSVSLAIGLVVLLLFGGLAGFLSVVGWGSSDSGVNGLIVGPFMAVIGVVVVLLICCVSLPALIGGVGLLKMRSWSRIFMIVISILHLLSFPIGTALGVYGVWVLFQDEARRLLEPGMPTPPASPIVPV